MHLAVISDLHLGAAGPADAFGHDDADFLRFLRFLEGNFERVVLLGDVWETLTSTIPGRAAEELRRARGAHPEIARRFSAPQYTYIHGNHDLIAAVVERAPEELTLSADGVRLLFTHGHQNDFVISNARWVSELGVWLGGWIRRFGLGPVYATLRRLDELRNGHTVDTAACGFQTWAVQVAKIKLADVVVTGHTHLAARVEHGDRLFLNSGSCSEGKISFLSIDTAGKKFAVHTSW
jgi:predicted phosphodiesterase